MASKSWLNDLQTAVLNNDQNMCTDLLTLVYDNPSLYQLRETLSKSHHGGTNDIFKLYNSVRAAPIPFLCTGCPFPLIVCLGDIKKSRRALEQGSDINEPMGLRSLTALHFAMTFCTLEHIAFLLNNGANVNQADNEGYTPLQTLIHMPHCMLRGDYYEIAKLLVNNGANVNLLIGATSPFLQSLEEHNVELVELFIRQGRADLNSTNEQLETILHLAARNKSSCILDLLLQMGGEKFLNSRDLLGRTPLHCALQSHHIENSKMLLRLGSICHQLKDEFTTTCAPLHLIMFLPKDVELIELVFKAGADLNEVSPVGKTALRMAYEKFNHWEKPIIKQIVRLTVLNKPVNASDLALIESSDRLNFYFQSCKKELSDIKSCRFYEDITLFDIMVLPHEKISRWACNDELVDNFNALDCCNKYPYYGTEINDRFNQEIQYQELIIDTVFQLRTIGSFGYLSDFCIEKIIDYLDEKDILAITMLDLISPDQ